VSLDDFFVVEAGDLSGAVVVDVSVLLAQPNATALRIAAAIRRIDFIGGAS
jgi:hypothetical protein